MIIILTGDVMIGRTFNEYLVEHPQCGDYTNKCYIFGNTKDIIKQSDLFCINLETTLTNSTDKYPNKMFNFKLNPKLGKKILKDIGVNYCALANNHIYDYKEQGLKDTIKTLDQLNIKYSGIGKNPAIFHNKIGIFSISDHPIEWKEKNINFISSIKEFKTQIKQYNLKFVILFIHWGPNFIKTPTNEMKYLAKELLNDGTVNIIAGTSSHHVQEIEIINNGIVFYGLGDFIDDYAIDEQFKSNLGMMAWLELDSNYNLKTWKTIPTEIRKDILQVNLATGLKRTLY